MYRDVIPVAVKVLPICDEHTMCELRAYQRISSLSSPFFLKAMPAVHAPGFFYLPLELGTSDLLERADAGGGLDEDAAKDLMCGVFEAVALLHANHIAHLDVKPENIIIVDDIAKLSDFGCAHVSKTARASAGPMWTARQAGTKMYACPEALAARSRDASSYGLRRTTTAEPGCCPEEVAGPAPRRAVSSTAAAASLLPPSGLYDAFKADSWALGLTLATLVTGFHPWELAADADERFVLWRSSYDAQDSLGSGSALSKQAVHAWGCLFGSLKSQRGDALTPDFIHLIRWLLHPNPAHRASVEQARSHEWFSAAFEI